ncbi:hypothetical protein [uncultured Oxalicibacterium sp.]|uniref:hypothetical protein n=1 Tax=uncultured Oxalicibacterium sp. TaxID=1168540 RepID=UPI00260140FD|nr:hypothetical protein [uncultured Oxalicibacterium sp.]
MRVMKMKWLFFFVVAVFSSTAFAQLRIGEFVLGTPKAGVLPLLQQKFQSVGLVSESRYQLPVKLVSAVEPKNDYRLGDFQITKINAFFNEADLLSQIEIVLNTTQLEEVKKIIPYVERSQLEPIFKDTWEISLNDGEIVYFTSRLSDTTQIMLADKPTSIKNIEARRRSNLRFKNLGDKIDGLIDTLKDQQTTSGK